MRAVTPGCRGTEDKRERRSSREYRNCLMSCKRLENGDVMRLRKRSWRWSSMHSEMTILHKSWELLHATSFPQGMAAIIEAFQCAFRGFSRYT